MDRSSGISKNFDPCMGWLVVHKSMYQLTFAQPAFQVFPVQLVPLAVDSNTNHCVLPVVKATCQQNTIAQCEVFSH